MGVTALSCLPSCLLSYPQLWCFPPDSVSLPPFPWLPVARSFWVSVSPPPSLIPVSVIQPLSLVISPLFMLLLICRCVLLFPFPSACAVSLTRNFTHSLLHLLSSFTFSSGVLGHRNTCYAAVEGTDVCLHAFHTCALFMRACLCVLRVTTYPSPPQVSSNVSVSSGREGSDFPERTSHHSARCSAIPTLCPWIPVCLVCLSHPITSHFYQSSRVPCRNTSLPGSRSVFLLLHPYLLCLSFPSHPAHLPPHLG